MSLQAGTHLQSLKGKTVVVGVTGGIAAYKSISLVSMLTKSGSDVHVVLTESAQSFVTPLTFQSLSKNPVITSLFDEPNPSEIAHITLSDRADLVVVAPATANFIAKAAAGLADDFLSTMLLATKSSVLLAPAMNVNMLHHPLTQANLQKLQDIGYRVLAPASGTLACGWVGDGRLPEPEAIYQEIVNLLSEARSLDLNGIRLLVTAGATREHLDPVRVLTNPASGKMGYAIAEAAARRGAQVTLVSGPTQLERPNDCAFYPVTTALEMEKAVLELLGKHDVLIMSAAVSDWRPAQYQTQKVKKSEGAMVVEFVRNPDILLSVSDKRTDKQVIVGFAAETQHVIEYAVDKLNRKKLDMIVANDVSRNDVGFESNQNEVFLIRNEENIKPLPLMSKRDTADAILDELIPLIRERIQNV